MMSYSRILIWHPLTKIQLVLFRSELYTITTSRIRTVGSASTGINTRTYTFIYTDILSFLFIRCISIMQNGGISNSTRSLSLLTACKKKKWISLSVVTASSFLGNTIYQSFDIRKFQSYGGRWMIRGVAWREREGINRSSPCSPNPLAFQISVLCLRLSCPLTVRPLVLCGKNLKIIRTNKKYTSLWESSRTCVDF